MTFNYVKSGFGWLLVFAGIAFSSCDNKDNVSNARVEVRLTDAPGDYQEVNIDIQDVQVNVEDDSSGWKSINMQKGVYDLMKLTNGLDTLLGGVDLPAGKVSQIRLILGDNNSILVAGQVFDLKTPSAQQSGLKVQVHTELTAGVTYKVLLDFDAARSIVATGNGKFILKPVIRSIVQAKSGSIKGMVSPPASKPAIYALMGSDTIGTTFADTTSGQFLLKGLAAGTYTVTFAPMTGYLPTSRDSVSVTVGNATDLGTVTISQ
jgi:hypothetical protein